MIVRSCFHSRTTPPPLSYLRNALSTRHFHSSTCRRADGGNHYQTLDLPTNATPKEIKKQFYKLSKSHHPDLHPNDPTASQKFVQISEAYATLGSPEKKQRYDRDHIHIQSSSSPGSSSTSPQGSYSSASTSGPGGRPASGLSRRRTQFRGPPPSFYRSGGWGEHSEKRSSASQQSSHTAEAQGTSASGPAGPGMGPGGFARGFDGDVPHFDGKAHHQTLSEIEKRQRSRKRRTVQRESAEMAGNGSSVLFNFLVITGILGVVVASGSAFYGGQERVRRRQVVEAAGK